MPFVTTGASADAHPGALGEPGTNLAAGDNNFGSRLFYGMRFEGGVNLTGAWSADVGGFFLVPQGASSTVSSDSFGNPVIGRPVFNSAAGAERLAITSFPGVVAGSTVVETRTQLWGFEANGRLNVLAGEAKSFDLLVGYRRLQLNERLTISDNLTPLQDGLLTFLGNPVNAPNALADRDRFLTTNRFNGINLGARMRWQPGPDWFSCGAFTKVAFGSTNEKVTINGSTTLTGPGGQTVPTGVLALPGNIGTYTRSTFGVVPEFGLTLAAQPFRNVRLTMGYSYLYWNKVARPGNQIDRVINPTVEATSTSFGIPNAGANPSFTQIRESSFWMSALNFGFEIFY